MIYVGIDVAKDKHDCFISNSDGEVLFNVFTISNNQEGFETLFQRIVSASEDLNKVKVGLEATGHYSYNLLGFLLDKGLTTYVINPLHTNLYRKSLSLRLTKTDKVDAHTIASMLMSDVDLQSYSDTSYHNEELKSLTRYRFDKVQERAKLKTSVSRLVCILFPEFETLISTLHMASVYSLLSEFPSANAIASAHLTKLTNLLSKASKGRYGKDTAVMFRDAARSSIGSYIHFVKTEMMLAFLRDYNDSQSVIDIINKLYLELRPDRFEKLMPVLLADNGSEFSNPSALEIDSQGNRRTNVFYCNPSAPYEKGSAGRNHELIRYVTPKGEPFDGYTQSDISLMMDHINSYSRKSLGNKCPYDMFEFLYGHEFLELLGCRKVAPNDVTLNKSIFKGEGQS